LKIGRAAARRNAPKQPRVIRVGPHTGCICTKMHNTGGLSGNYFSKHLGFIVFFQISGVYLIFFLNTGGLSNLPPKIQGFIQDQDQISRIKDQRLKIKDQKSKIKDQRSKIKDKF